MILEVRYDFMHTYTYLKLLDHIDAVAMHISPRWNSIALVHTTFRMDYNFHSDLLQQLLWIRIVYTCMTYVHWERCFVILRPTVSLHHYFGLQPVCRETIIDSRGLSIILQTWSFISSRHQDLPLEESLLELSALL